MREIKFRAWYKGLKEMRTCESMLHLDEFFMMIMVDPDAYDIQ